MVHSASRIVFIALFIFVPSAVAAAQLSDRVVDGLGAISSVDGVKQIMYRKDSSGEGGWSGRIVRQFRDDPNEELWIRKGREPEDGFLMRRDESGNTVETRDRTGNVTRYPPPRGNGVSPTLAELEGGPGAKWKIEYRDRKGRWKTRECVLGGIETRRIGEAQYSAAQWRCLSRRSDWTYPMVSEFSAIYINDILRTIGEMQCWTHSYASETCGKTPHSYDGHSHYSAEAIEFAD